MFVPDVSARARDHVDGRRNFRRPHHDLGIVLLADRGDLAILLVEQYYDFAEALADRYWVMERGEFIARGPGSEMQAKGIRQLVAI